MTAVTESLLENNHDDVAGKKLQIGKKCDLINKALEENDCGKLLQLAVSKYGLISDSIRCKVWPKLLLLDIVESSPKPDLNTIQEHPYYNQVVLDVNRALKRFPPSIKEQQRMSMQDQLIVLIVRVLMKHPHLHYYQGYHDICVTFLLVLGEEVGFIVVEKLSNKYLKDFMDVTMEKTNNLLYYLYAIVGEENMALRSYLEKSDVGVMFCLSWVITWFGHVLEDYSNVVRLYDFFLASQPLMPIYLSAAIVLHREEEIFETECDLAMMHFTLSKISDDLPFENLIEKASQLYLQYPPDQLTEECNKIIKLKAQQLLEEKKTQKIRKNQWNNRNKGALVVSCHTMYNWLLNKNKNCYLRNWSITLATGATFAVALYAILYSYGSKAK